MTEIGEISKWFKLFNTGETVFHTCVCHTRFWNMGEYEEMMRGVWPEPLNGCCHLLFCCLISSNPKAKWGKTVCRGGNASAISQQKTVSSSVAKERRDRASSRELWVWRPPVRMRSSLREYLKKIFQKMQDLIGEGIDWWHLGKKPITASKESHYIRNAEAGSASAVEDTHRRESWQHLKSWKVHFPPNNLCSWCW